MASTYSSRLRIELIGTGEQSGIWGDTTNTNLGTLIDEAVAGVASITMTDANYTLTVADGATDQSRKAVLVMSGSLSQARNVICPSSQKVYIFKNSTTGGYALTLKTSSGSGVSVPNGATTVLYCDGTDVYQVGISSNSPNFTGSISLDGSVVINDSGADADVRIEGDTDANLLFTDASTDRVGVGTNAPGSKLDVKGTLRLSGSASGYVGFSPATAAGSTTYTLPSADGTANQVLQTDGSAVLSWASAALTGSANTFTGNQTVVGTITTRAASTQDAIIISGRAGGTSSYAITLVPTTLFGSRTFTLPEPNEDVTVGYLNLPQNSQSAAYTLVAADAGKHIFHPAADTTARTFTIPANSSVPYPLGTAITFINQNGAGVVTIAITSDTMRLAGQGTTGSRTLAANGVATVIKIASTEWIISGSGLT